MSPLVVPGLLLAGVLALSGVAKLASPQANADSFRSLRLPEVLSHLRAPLLLPYAELLLALALIVAPGTAHIVVAIASLLLMLAYTGIVARALTFSEPVTCSCFGKLGLGAITRLTVVRNLILALVAALALADAVSQPRSLAARLLDADGHAWGWLAMLALAVAATGLIVQSTAAPAPTGLHTPLHGSGEASTSEDDDGLDYIRQPIPFARVRTPDGGHVSLRDLAATAPQLLIFLNTGCGPCINVMGILPDFIARNPEVVVRPVLHADTEPERIPSWMESRLLDEDGALSQTFNVPTPAAVLLGADGLLAGGPVVGEPAVRAFLDDVAAELAEVRSSAGISTAPPPAHEPGTTSGTVLTGTVLDPVTPETVASGTIGGVRGPNGELVFEFDIAEARRNHG